MNKCGYDDCFTCPYPDCVLDAERKRKAYQKEWNDKHKAHNKKRNHKYFQDHKQEIYTQRKTYYQRNKDKILAKAKEKRYLKKIMEGKCWECHKEFQPASTVLKYKGKFFCSDSCLAEYLLDHAEGITEIEYDTPENIRICALEKKGEY